MLLHTMVQALAFVEELQLLATRCYQKFVEYNPAGSEATTPRGGFSSPHVIDGLRHVLLLGPVADASCVMLYAP